MWESCWGERARERRQEEPSRRAHSAAAVALAQAANAADVASKLGLIQLIARLTPIGSHGSHCPSHASQSGLADEKEKNRCRPSHSRRPLAPDDASQLRLAINLLQRQLLALRDEPQRRGVDAVAFATTVAGAVIKDMT